MIIDNIIDCTVEIYDKATRGDLEVLNKTGKEQPVDVLYEAYLSITDEFNLQIENSRYIFELETKQNSQYCQVMISRIKLGVRLLDLMIENPAFATDDVIDIARTSMEAGGVMWKNHDFTKILNSAKGKISYYENQIEINNQKIEGLKTDTGKEGSIYSLVSLLRGDGVVVNKDDSLMILAECLNNLNRKNKKQ
jgi:hypothetical protein